MTHQPDSTHHQTTHQLASAMSSSKNILSSDVEIHGSLKFSHDLIIDGKIDGDVTSDGTLTIGENARMKGKVQTKSVTIFGKVEGNITVTDRCELKSNAELLGDIQAGTLSIEEGATFMGTSTVGTGAGRPASASLGKPKEAQPTPPKGGADSSGSSSSSSEKKLAATS